ncbi:MAG: 50S ribosomal protein L21 [Actinomycetota bacterium]
MYAIIRTGGHQEKVSPGEQIAVDYLNKQAVGDTVKFTALLVSADDGTLVSDHKELAEKAAVTGTVIQHIKADKIDVFQYRNKTGYRRHTGHRQPMTLVEITEIRLGDIVGTAPVPTAEPEQPAEEPTEKPAAAPKKAKPAAKKAPARKAAPKKAAPKAAAKKAAPKKK